MVDDGGGIVPTDDDADGFLFDSTLAAFIHGGPAQGGPVKVDRENAQRYTVIQSNVR